MKNIIQRLISISENLWNHAESEHQFYWTKALKNAQKVIKEAKMIKIDDETWVCEQCHYMNVGSICTNCQLLKTESDKIAEMNNKKEDVDEEEDWCW